MTKLEHILNDGPAEVIERRLRELGTRASTKVPRSLDHAIEYSILAPGKRLRPRLVLAIAGSTPAAIDVACAVEMVHTASLILDDLPSMDDAALRRGRETTHRRFDESTAILAAVALIAGAFEVIAQCDTGPDAKARLSETLAASIGRNGMCAGQALDLALSATTAADAEEVNGLKTASLFVSAANMGGILRGLDAAQIAEVERFAHHLGQAYQLADDALDRAESPAITGKDVLADENKPTVDRLTDVNTASNLRRVHLAEADAAIIRAGLYRIDVRSLFDGLYQRSES